MPALASGMSPEFVGRNKQWRIPVKEMFPSGHPMNNQNGPQVDSRMSLPRLRSPSPFEVGAKAKCKAERAPEVKNVLEPDWQLQFAGKRRWNGSGVPRLSRAGKPTCFRSWQPPSSSLRMPTLIPSATGNPIQSEDESQPLMRDPNHPPTIPRG